MERKDIWFAVVNPHAGSGKTISEWQKAEKLLRERGVRYSSEKTERKGHAVELVQAAAAKGYRKFIAVGGDGTAHEVLNGIMRFRESNPVPLEDFTMTVIPIGSGNDWIKTHGIPHDTAEVVEMIASGHVGRQDVVKVTRPNPDGLQDSELGHDYMLNIGGVGFDARVCERVNAQKDMGKSGKLLYFNALLKVIANFYSFPAKVVGDGKLLFEGDCYSMAFGVGPFSGGGMRQVPLARFDDGLVDVMIVPKIPMKKLLPKLPKLFNGSLATDPEIIMAQCSRIEVTPLSDLLEPAEIDGEVVGSFPLSLEILPGRINVITNK